MMPVESRIEPREAHDPHGAASPSGFTVLEVLVALVVAAVLSSSLLSIQRQAITLNSGSDNLWKGIDVAQEFLTRRYPAQMVNPSNTWVTWTDGKDVKWKLTKEEVQDDRFTDDMRLELDSEGTILTWQWYRPHKIYKVLAK